MYFKYTTSTLNLFNYLVMPNYTYTISAALATKVILPTKGSQNIDRERKRESLHYIFEIGQQTGRIH